MRHRSYHQPSNITILFMALAIFLFAYKFVVPLLAAIDPLVPIR